MVDGADMEHARTVFHVNARKVVKDALSNARIQATNLFFKLIKGQPMNKTRGSSQTYLTEEEYGQVNQFRVAVLYDAMLTFQLCK